MTQKRSVTIHFMDGTKIAYDFPQQIADDSTMSSKIGAAGQAVYRNRR